LPAIKRGRTAQYHGHGCGSAEDFFIAIQRGIFRKVASRNGNAIV